MKKVILIASLIMVSLAFSLPRNPFYRIFNARFLFPNETLVQDDTLNTNYSSYYFVTDSTAKDSIQSEIFPLETNNILVNIRLDSIDTDTTIDTTNVAFLFGSWIGFMDTLGYDDGFQWDTLGVITAGDSIISVEVQDSTWSWTCSPWGCLKVIELDTSCNRIWIEVITKKGDRE